jgi:raffinose/stachyose/melibiose transport system substrate-binding protein
VNGQSEHPDAALEVLNFLISDPALVLENAAGSAFGEWVVPLHFTEEDFPEGTDPRVVRFFSDFAAVTGEGRYGYTTWTFWPADPMQLWTDIELVWAGDMSIPGYLAVQQEAWDEAHSRRNRTHSARLCSVICTAPVCDLIALNLEGICFSQYG